MASLRLLNSVIKRNLSLHVCKTFTRGFHLTRACNASPIIQGTLKLRKRKTAVTHEQNIKKKLLKKGDPGLQMPSTGWMPKQTVDGDFYGIESDSGAIVIPGNPSETKMRKFQYLFQNKESAPSYDDERTVETNFGSIRYDSDNPTHEPDADMNFEPPMYVEASDGINKVHNLLRFISQDSDECNTNPEDCRQSIIPNVRQQQSNKFQNVDIDQNCKEISGIGNFIDGAYFEKISDPEKYQDVNKSNEKADARTSCSEFDDDCTENTGNHCGQENVKTAFVHEKDFSEQFPDFNRQIANINSNNKENILSVNRNSGAEKEMSNFIDDSYFPELSNSVVCKDVHDSTDSKYASTLCSELGIQSLAEDDRYDFTQSTSFLSQKEKVEPSSAHQKSSNESFPAYDKKHIKPPKHLSSFDRRELNAFSESEELKCSEFDNMNEQDEAFAEKNYANHVPTNETRGISQMSSELNFGVSTLPSEFMNESKPCSIKKKTVKNLKKSADYSESNNGNPDSAFNYVAKFRKQEESTGENIDTRALREQSADKLDSKGFRILKNQTDDLSLYTRMELVDMMKDRILFSNDDILVLNKPYGLVMHDSKTTTLPTLSSLLRELACQLDKNSTNPQLFTIHRLDKETTGCLLLARNEKSAMHLKSLFASRKILKTYWVVTSRVPEPTHGTIDIPIAEGMINDRIRMVLKPELSPEIKYKSHVRKSKQAITHYKVLSSAGNAALIEVRPETGIKHQIRVHFGFGLSCPILGDHKYSNLTKLAPQKLPNDILERLYIRQSKARYVPMHIHSRVIEIPGFLNGQDLYVSAPLPNHMYKNLKNLRIKKNP